jgi:Zn-dependent protease with chaperone function
MDFFGHQERARRRTSGLVVLYALAVGGIVAAVYLVIAATFVINNDGDTPVSLWNPTLFTITAGAVLAVVILGSLFKTMQLSKGGSVVATSLGGRPVAPDTRDADERKLLNVVEEMALAVGVAVPQVYLLDDEPGINAFAAGFSTRDAVIGVTRGCMETLTRDELQGVIAHEFSHIVNGDMRLNIRLMGILFGILMLTIVGRVLLRSAHFSGGRSRGGKKEGGNPLPFIGLALIIIGYIGVFFANLIKSAISRQREFLSDASAVQYTRNPSGISSALKKIGGLDIGASVRNAHASEASHMFFGPVGGFSLASMFATHPPLAERIRRLDPSFNPEIAAMQDDGDRQRGADASAMSGLAAGFQSGAPGSINIRAAAGTLRTIPEALLAEVRDPVGARSVIYGLLWSGDATAQAAQRQAVGADPQAVALLETVRPMLARLPAAARLPLAELTVPALRLLTKDQYARFRQTVQALTEADQEIDLFEFALSHMIIRHVESAFGRTSTAPVRYRSVASVLPACSAVLAGLASWGTSGTAAADSSYQAGLKALGQPPDALDPESVSLETISRSLSTLCEASPAVKRKVIEACSACILSDGAVAAEEAELLRAVADAMDVPMPPLQF